MSDRLLMGGIVVTSALLITSSLVATCGGRLDRSTWRETALDARDGWARCNALLESHLKTDRQLLGSMRNDGDHGKLNEYPFSKTVQCPIGTRVEQVWQRDGRVQQLKCGADAGAYLVWDYDGDGPTRWRYESYDGVYVPPPVFPNQWPGPPPGSVTLNNSGMLGDLKPKPMGRVVGSLACKPGAPNCFMIDTLAGCEPTTLRPEDSHDGVINAVGRVKCPPRATSQLWAPLDGGMMFTTVVDAGAWWVAEPRNVVFRGNTSHDVFAAFTDGGYRLHLDTGQRATFKCADGVPVFERGAHDDATLFCRPRAPVPFGELVTCDLVYRTNGLQRCTRADGGAFEIRR